MPGYVHTKFFALKIPDLQWSLELVNSFHPLHCQLIGVCNFYQLNIKGRFCTVQAWRLDRYYFTTLSYRGFTFGVFNSAFSPQTAVLPNNRP